MWVPFSISHKKPDWLCNFILQPSITHIPIYAPLLELCPQEDPVLAASCSAWADLSGFDLKLQTEEGWKYQRDKASHTGRLPRQFIHLENRAIPKLWSAISSPVWLKRLFQIWCSWLLIKPFNRADESAAPREGWARVLNLSVHWHKRSWVHTGT